MGDQQTEPPEDKEIIVVSSGLASSVVKQWMGLGDDDDPYQDAPAIDDSKARTRHLGLGAKFLPHNKVLGAQATVEHRLLKRVERGGRQRDAEGAEAAPDRGQQGASGSMAPGNRTAGGEDSDDSDGDGRAGAFGRSNQHAGKGFQERRAEMLLASPNGKRKKKKRKKGSQTDPA